MIKGLKDSSCRRLLIEHYHSRLYETSYLVFLSLPNQVPFITAIFLNEEKAPFSRGLKHWNSRGVSTE